jgi:hypothetical protein
MRTSTMSNDDLPQRWIAESPGWCERCFKNWKACVCGALFGLAIYQTQELQDEVVGQAAQRIITMAFAPTSVTSGSLTLYYSGFPPMEVIGNPVTGGEIAAQASEIGRAATARKFMVEIDRKLAEATQIYWREPPKDG